MFNFLRCGFWASGRTALYINFQRTPLHSSMCPATCIVHVSRCKLREAPAALRGRQGPGPGPTFLRLPRFFVLLLLPLGSTAHLDFAADARPLSLYSDRVATIMKNRTFPFFHRSVYSSSCRTDSPTTFNHFLPLAFPRPVRLNDADPVRIARASGRKRHQTGLASAPRLSASTRRRGDSQEEPAGEVPPPSRSTWTACARSCTVCLVWGVGCCGTCYIAPCGVLGGTVQHILLRCIGVI